MSRPHAAHPPTPHRALAWAVLWGLSGLSVLTLETVWMRQLAAVAGNTALAAAVVMGAFFIAAALGNLLGAWIIPGCANPLRRYGQFEILTAVVALASALLHRFAAEDLGMLSAVLLLVGPASLCSGLGFSCLGEAFIGQTGQRTSRGGLFYGANLLGAALGVCAGGVWLPFHLGMWGAFKVAVAMLGVGGALALAVARSTMLTQKTTQAEHPESAAPAAVGWLILGASGLLSLAAQALVIVWVRQIMAGSVYAVCGVLAVFVGGLGVGALGAAALRRRGWAAADLLRKSAAMGAVFLFLIPGVSEDFCGMEMPLTAATPTGMLLQTIWRCGLLLPLAVVLGGIFPTGWELVQQRSACHSRVLGTALAVNKIAAGLGAVGAMFWLMPTFGLARSTQAIGWAYLVLALLPVVFIGRRDAQTLIAVMLACGIGVHFSWPQSKVLGLTEKEVLIEAQTSVYGPVAVVEDRDTASRHILLNTRQRLSGTGSALSSQRHQSWVPLLLCRQPDRVLTIGMAAGISAAAALDAPIKQLQSVELVPEVVDAARRQFSAWNAPLFADPRSEVIVDDGRRVLDRRGGGGWDVIICDLFFPAEESSALLYSQEFFQRCRRRLSARGIVCLWLPCYQHTPETAGMIAHTFAETFPNAIMVRAGFDPVSPVVGLIGSSSPMEISRQFLADQLAAPWAKKVAEQSVFFRSPDHALLLLICGLRSARPSFSSYPLITDDHPLLAWLGPREPNGRERLHGFPFLDWIGKRALGGEFPSLLPGDLDQSEVLGAIRAGNFYFAASAAARSLPGDPRPPSVRRRQVDDYLRRARELWPAAVLPADPAMW